MFDESHKKSFLFNSIPHRFLEAQQKINKVLLWAILVGVLTGLMSVAFFRAFEELIAHRQHLIELVKNIAILNWLIPALISGIMAYLAFLLIDKFAPEAAGGGIAQIEGAMDGLLPLHWQKVIPVKFVSSSLTLASGMLIGPEAPTIQIGGHIGKMIGNGLGATKDQIITLIAAGASAGMAAAFNAPLSGIIFVLEEMRPNFEYPTSSLRAVILASVTGSIVFRYFKGQDSILKITAFQAPPLESIWVFILLGIMLGIIGYIFNYLLLNILEYCFFQRRLYFSFVQWGLIVGLLIGFLNWLYWPITYDGETVIIWIFNNIESGWIMLSIFFARFLLTILSAGINGPGGVLAPLLALATIFSLGFARFIEHFLPGLLPEPAVLAIAGMGGLIAASGRAPLTGIILSAEITHNYSMILVLIVTCLTSTMTAHALGAQPMYSARLQKMLKYKVNKSSTQSISLAESDD